MIAAAQAETAEVRLGSHFRDVAGYPMARFGALAEVMQRLNLGAQLFVRNVENCQNLIAIPPGRWRGYDTTHNTDTIIQSLRVACWTALQIDPATAVTASEPGDRITPDMIRGIMDHAERLSAGDEEWAKALLTFSGATIACKDPERCTLSAPEGSEWADYALQFELLAVRGEERFVEVAQLYLGRAGFIYGVLWCETESGGAVVAMFPDVR